jgi:class 3 adenylate cyclase/tetratricopeptide (TPR) repeat protein
MLFADIKGSMDLIEDLDPEEARAIVDPALKLMMEAVEHYGGYVAQPTGDGIFALFGAPVAHEDHPQRALFAALRMQAEVKRYTEKLRAEKEVNLQVRVGANTGEVVVREIRTGKPTEYAPIGHSTGVAARLEALAAPGSIVISESLRKLVGGYFALKPLGPARVKGVSEPLEVYEVTGLGPLRSRFQRALGRGLTKFVGRQAETEGLTRLAELAKSGQGQILAVVAEPGVGKSRLFHQFKAVSQADWMVLESSAVSYGKASPYLPLIELLHSYFNLKPGDDVRKSREKIVEKVLGSDGSLTNGLPHLFGLLGIGEGEDSRARMDPQVRRHTLDTVKRLLLRESLNQPLMLIFEDLHLIDEETQVFLNLLADSLWTAKILLLVNYRPEYSDPWTNKTYYTQLRLDPLTRETADEILDELLGASVRVSDDRLRALKRLIIDRTAGNPFFIEEIVQALFEEGLLKRNGTIKLARSVDALEVPTTVQAILASRIDRLPAEEKELLQILAVIGEGFPQSLVRAVMDPAGDTPPSRAPLHSSVKEIELNRLLQHLQLAEFIYEQPATDDVEYTFKHALTQEVTYKSVLMERRKLLHEKVGAAIEALFAQSINDHLGQLAHHYGRSSNVDKAVEYLDRAGQQAKIRGAFKEAELYFKNAIGALSAKPETSERIKREFNLQWALWQALSFTRGAGTVETVRVAKRLREMTEKIDNPEQVINALAAAWNVALFENDMTGQQQIAEELMETAERSRSRYGLTLAHSYMGSFFMRRAELIKAMQHYQATIASYEEAEWSESVLQPHIRALSRLSAVLWHLGMADQGRAKLGEAIFLSERSKSPVQMLQALSVASSFYMDLRECANGDGVSERLSTLAREQELPESPEGLVYRGWVMAERGRTDEGIALIRAGLDSSAKLSRSYLAVCFRALSEAQARAGQVEEALASIEEALSVVGETQIHFPSVLWWRAELRLYSGDEASAASDFCEAIRTAQRIGSKAYELRATTSLARLLAKQGKRDEARSMLADIYNWFTEGFDTADLKEAKMLLDDLRS